LALISVFCIPKLGSSQSLNYSAQVGTSSVVVKLICRHQVVKVSRKLINGHQSMNLLMFRAAAAAAVLGKQ